MNDTSNTGRRVFIPAVAITSLEYTEEQIREIQRASRDYILNGYEHWRVEKTKIIDWIQEEKKQLS